MKFLILGGTRFVGRHITQAALDAGHTVTLFNRGKSNTDIFSSVETLIGDRDGNLTALNGRTWDAVIDVNGYLPRLVRDSATLLKPAIGQYIFVSTVSVYAEFDKPIDENSKLIELDDPTVEEITGDTYGGLKVLCERVVQEVFGNTALIARPGYIIGPYDHTDRFSYWVWRAAQGGEMLAPGNPAESEQAIDARDLAQWMIQMAEKKQVGIYNSAGNTFKYSTVIEKAKQLSEKNTQLVWISESFAKEHDLLDKKLPMWSPGDEYAGSRNVDISRAVNAGLTMRPIETTTADTLTWLQEREATDYQWVRGFEDPTEEEKWVVAWKKDNDNA